MEVDLSGYLKVVSPISKSNLHTMTQNCLKGDLEQAIRGVQGKKLDDLSLEERLIYSVLLSEACFYDDAKRTYEGLTEEKTQEIIKKYKEADLLYQRAKEAFQEGAREESCILCKQSLDFNPENLECLALLTYLHMSEGQYEEVEALVTEGLSLDALHPFFCEVKLFLQILKEEKDSSSEVLLLQDPIYRLAHSYLNQSKS